MLKPNHFTDVFVELAEVKVTEVMEVDVHEHRPTKNLIILKIWGVNLTVLAF